MPAVVPFIPLIAAGAGMIASNSQNKSNQAAATSAADSANAQQAQAQQQAYAHQDQAQQQALARQAAYMGANKSPVQGWGQRIQGPPQSSPASVGGGVLGPNGMPVPGMQGQQAGMQQRPQPQGQIPPELMKMLFAMMQQRQQQQPQQQPQDPPVAPPVTPQVPELRNHPHHGGPGWRFQGGERE